MILCLKVDNDKTNDYHTCQALFDFIKLTIPSIDWDPIPILNKTCNIINKSVIYLKKEES